VKKPAAKSGKRVLADDDHDVWSHTTQSVEPLKKVKDRHHPASERPAVHATVKPNVDTQKPKVTKASVTKTAGAAPAQTPKSKTPPPIATFDRKKVRKIRSGQVDLDGKIDLHGMRQDEAHDALVRFLMRAQSKGWRWVLIITGKGKRADRDDDAPFDMTQERQRGVLKRNVPRWLDEPDMRMLVVSYTTAAIQHGGEGALYVHLRKS
jgi:DNA-nicking Smr family endonuclease